MAKDWAKQFLNSKRWLACRNSYISKRLTIDGGLCEKCHKEFGYIVHHKITLTEQNINNPNISLNHELLSYECKDCHDWEPGHFYEAHGIKRSRCVFDENGNPIER